MVPATAHTECPICPPEFTERCAHWDGRTVVLDKYATYEGDTVCAVWFEDDAKECSIGDYPLFFGIGQEAQALAAFHAVEEMMLRGAD